MNRAIEYQNVALIGDRVVDAARWIGVHPSLMATAHIPMIEAKMPVSRQVECTACVLGRRRSAFFGAARRMGIARVVVERNAGDDINPYESVDMVRSQGFSVDVADFSHGVENGIREMCAILGKSHRSRERVATYRTALTNAQERLQQIRGCRVLALMGIVYPVSGDEYLLTEDAGALDEFILAPSACVNVSGLVGSRDESQEEQDIRVVHDIDGIVEAAPDLIALTCSPVPGLKAVHTRIAANPRLLDVPALTNHALFSLPHCCESEATELPATITRWVDAIQRVS